MDPLPQEIVAQEIDDDENYHTELFGFLRCLRGYSVFVDECDEYCSPHGMDPQFRKFVNYIRHAGMNAILVARRASEISKTLTALASDILLFHMHDATDLKFVKESCGAAWADACPNLGLGQYLRFTWTSWQNRVDNTQVVGHNDQNEVTVSENLEDGQNGRITGSSRSEDYADVPGGDSRSPNPPNP